MKDQSKKLRSDTIRTTLQKILFPLPQDQEKQGFQPNFYIRFLRGVAKALISVLRLNGKNRFSNEFMQMLDPTIETEVSGHEKLIFRTGHGRLLWRARTLLTEEPMIISWIDTFGENDCFYDVGANVGNYSLYAAKRGVQTYAIEPEYLNVSVLYENIFLNKVQNVCMPIPIALGERTKQDDFYIKSISKGDALHSIGRKSYLLDASVASTERLSTLVMTLDDLIATFDLPRPTRLKIDVDNNELQVVLGATETLEFVKEIYIELDTKLSEHREVITLLQSRSFRIINDESIARKWNQEITNYIFSKEQKQ